MPPHGFRRHPSSPVKGYICLCLKAQGQNTLHLIRRKPNGLRVRRQRNICAHCDSPIAQDFETHTAIARNLKAKLRYRGYLPPMAGVQQVCVSITDHHAARR